MKRWLIIWVLAGALLGCASIQEAENNQSNEFPDPVQTRQNMQQMQRSTQEAENNQSNEFPDPVQTRQNMQQMQRSIMDSRQRRMGMGR
jgi:hypothetical protein